MIDMEIGKRIKNRRRELGLTQIQVYEAIGISSGNLSSIENSKILPSSASLIGLSKILNCTTDFLLLGTPLKSEKIEVSNFKDQQFLDSFQQLPDEEKERRQQ